MRITPATLLKIARDTAARLARKDLNLLSVYLHGSVLEDLPLLGGTTDIDLVCVHIEDVGVQREIERLTDEIHLDIAHHTRTDYGNTRELRVHPWLGPTIFGCKILYDPQHFMDLTQANVRGQFNRPEFILERSRGQAEHARQMWLTMYNMSADPGLDEVNLYLRAVEHVANAVTSLSGPLLTERRFLIRFPERAAAVGRQGFYPGLLGLLGGPNVDPETLQDWLQAWQSAYEGIPKGEVPPRLHPHRLNYYRRAFEYILGGERPLGVLWPMLRTWTKAVSLLPEESGERGSWQEALHRLGLLGSGFSERVAALDAYLDTVEETLEEWGRDSGAEYEQELV